MIEVWLRGPVLEISPFLQPVAHALLQAEEELTELLKAFPDELLWQRPAGMASPGFHLRHMAGVLDRLFTYAAGKPLNAEQLEYLKDEGVETAITTRELVELFGRQVQSSINYLKCITEKELTETRAVGRARLPSTVLGLLVHAAEHTMRHLGQLLVTVKWLIADGRHSTLNT